MNLPGKKMSGKSLISEMDLRVRRMQKLVEDEGDSFAKKADMYYQKRPELIALVEEFQRIYKTLAERLDNGDLMRKNNIPSSDAQSQCSGISDIGSELPSTMPSPELRLTRGRSGGPRAAGFDFFLGGSGNLALDMCDFSTLDYESGPDDFTIKNYFASNEGESLDDSSEAEIVDPVGKVDAFQDDVVRELQEKEIYAKKLEDQLQSSQEELSLCKNQLSKEKQEVSKLNDRVSMYKSTLLERDQEIRGLKSKISNADVTLSRENERLQVEIRKISTQRMFLEDRVKEMEVRRQSLEDEIRRVKTARALKEASHEAKIDRLTLECASKDKFVTGLIQSLIELQLELDVAMLEKDEVNSFIDALAAEASSKDDLIDRMNVHLQKMHAEHVELVAAAERARKSADGLQERVRELEKEVEKKQKVIVEGAEEKREAIRQLCFSLEHYRNGYHRLRQLSMSGNKQREPEKTS